MTRLEILIKGAIEGIVLDKAKKIEAEILAIADTKKAEGNKKMEQIKEEARLEEERKAAEKVVAEQRAKDTERAYVWNYLNKLSMTSRLTAG